MKHQWYDCISDHGRRLWSAIEQPTLRHCLHYECGIYKKRSDRSPLACVHVDNEYNLPLVRALAILALLVFAATALSALLRALSPRSCTRHIRLRLGNKKQKC